MLASSVRRSSKAIACRAPSPRDLLVRLCSAIPLPCVNQVPYCGVLASAAANRDEVVPETEPLLRNLGSPN